MAGDATSTAQNQPADRRWAPGEYAECTHDSSWFSNGSTVSKAGPVAGDVVRVRSVVIKRCPWNGKLVEMLTFDRWPKAAYPATAFRRGEKPKLTLRSITRMAKRDPHTAGIGAAGIVTAVCYGAAAVAQILGGDR